MTQVNITLSHEEVLQVLSGNRDDAFKLLITRILNAVMLAESEEQRRPSQIDRRRCLLYNDIGIKDNNAKAGQHKGKGNSAAS